MLIKFLFILSIILILALPSAAKPRKNYTVCVQSYVEYMPYSRYENGEYLGFNRELLDLFATLNKTHFSYHGLPLKRLARQFLAGKCNVRYPDNPYWEASLKKRRKINYSQPVIRYIDGVIVRKENMGKGVQNLKALGMILGFTPYGYDEYTRSGQIQIFENKNILGLFQQVLKNRVDGAYGNVTISKYYIKKLSKKLNQPVELKFDPSLPHINSYRTLSSIHYKDLIDSFNLFLINYKADINAIKRKYDLIPAP